MNEFSYTYAVWHGKPDAPQRTIYKCSNQITSEQGILELEKQLGSTVLGMCLLDMDTKERFPYFHDRPSPSKVTCIKRAIVQVMLVSVASFSFFFGIGILAFGEEYLGRILKSSVAFAIVPGFLISAETLRDRWHEEDESDV